MSTQPGQTLPQNTNGASGFNFDVNQMMNGMFSIKLLESMQHSMSKSAESGEINTMTILYFALVIFMVPIKEFVTAMILQLRVFGTYLSQKFPELCKSASISTFDTLRNLWNNYMVQHAKVVEVELSEEEKREKLKNVLELEVKNMTPNIIKYIVDYIKRTDGCVYTEQIINQTRLNLNSYISKQKYVIKNINFDEDIECKIFNPLTINFRDSVDTETQIIDYTTLSDQTDNHNPEYLQSLKPKSVFDIISNTTLARFLSESQDFINVTATLQNAGIEPRVGRIGNLLGKVHITSIAHTLASSHKEFTPLLEISNELIKFTSLLLTLFSLNDNIVKFNKNNMVFEKINCTLYIKPVWSNADWDSSVCQVGVSWASHVNVVALHLLEIRRKSAQIFDKASEFKIILKSEKISANVLYDKWNNYVNKLITDNKINQNNNELVKINKLSVVFETKKETQENPEYKAYTEQKKLLHELMGGGNDKKTAATDPNAKTEAKGKRDDDDDYGMYGFGGGAKHQQRYLYKFYDKISSGPPPEQITIETQVPKVKVEEISSFVKPIDTLYLREKDLTELKDILANFKNSDSLYRELGIKKKLGFMMDGEPGVGKSTTILAIATYLGYDIYYVSLNGLTKNSELQMLFDYVNNHCSKKGMIIFEDIDAHGVVHDRGHKEKSFTNALNAKDDNLDISYILNILDGTLSREDSVVIMTTNHLEQLDPALYRSGRCDVVLRLKKCDRYQIQLIFKTIMKHQIDETVLERIPEDLYTPSKIIFGILPYIYRKNLTDAEIMDAFIPKDNMNLEKEKENEIKREREIRNVNEQLNKQVAQCAAFNVANVDNDVKIFENSEIDLDFEMNTLKLTDDTPKPPSVVKKNKKKSITI